MAAAERAARRFPSSTRLVELATGAVFLGAYLLFDSPALLIQRLLFACAMIVLFVIDLEHRILPDVITLPGIVLGFVFSLFLPPGGATRSSASLSAAARCG